MRELLAEDGHADGDAGDDGLGEGGADREAVDEVVHAVAEDDHPVAGSFRCQVLSPIWISFLQICREFSRKSSKTTGNETTFQEE